MFVAIGQTQEKKNNLCLSRFNCERGNERFLFARSPNRHRNDNNLLVSVINISIQITPETCQCIH